MRTSGAVPPLVAIKEKEDELRHRLEEAHRQAEARIHAAREEATESVAQARRQAKEQADTWFQQGVATAKQEAEAMVAAAQEKTAAMRRRSGGRMDKAVRWIIEMVLPPDTSVIHRPGPSRALTADGVQEESSCFSKWPRSR